MKGASIVMTWNIVGQTRRNWAQRAEARAYGMRSGVSVLGLGSREISVRPSLLRTFWYCGTARKWRISKFCPSPHLLSNVWLSILEPPHPPPTTQADSHLVETAQLMHLPNLIHSPNLLATVSLIILKPFQRNEPITTKLIFAKKNFHITTLHSRCDISSNISGVRTWNYYLRRFWS